MTSSPQCFPASEFEARATRAQAAMDSLGLSALLLSTEPEVRYFTGFLSRFWESPARPWFVILPAQGKPVAVIPAIGAALMGRSWIDDIRTWRSPDYTDDGIGLLASALMDLTPKGARIGVPADLETHVRMPLNSWTRLNDSLEGRQLVGDANCMRRLREVKSDAEIDKIRTACSIANRAFDRVPEIARAGVPLARVFRDFQRLCLEEGADWVPYLAGGAAPQGYGDVISPADERPLQGGDVMMLDTGLVHDGYFCDFDRNYSVGPPSPQVAEGHHRLIEATQAGFKAARVGATAADVFAAMDQIVTGGAGGSDAGRFGHGLGMQLTETPSLIPDDHRVLEAGMVLTLEPGVDLGDGKLMVHEENIVIRPDGAEWLSAPSSPAIREIAL